MQSGTNTTDSLRRVFYEGFVAQDIAEPLASFDLAADLAEVRSFMVDRPLTVIGLRENGIITHYLEQSEIDDRPLTEQARPLSETKDRGDLDAASHTRLRTKRIELRLGRDARSAGRRDRSRRL